LAIRRLAVLFAILLGSRFSFSAPQLPCASEAEYRALLGQVEQRSEQPDISLAELADAVPAQCSFMAAGQTFQLSNSGMQRELREIAAKPEIRSARLKIFQDALRQRLVLSPVDSSSGSFTAGPCGSVRWKPFAR
jgi:hypothetical protein